MLEYITFNSDKFSREKGDNDFSALTSNTIIMCPDFKTVKFLSEEIAGTINTKREHNTYWCDDADIGTARISYDNENNAKIIISNQTIMINHSPELLLKTTEINDLWFAEKTCDNKIKLRPLSCYKYATESWEKGVEYIYKLYLDGRYGVVQPKYKKTRIVIPTEITPNTILEVAKAIKSQT